MTEAGPISPWRSNGATQFSAAVSDHRPRPNSPDANGLGQPDPHLGQSGSGPHLTNAPSKSHTEGAGAGSPDGFVFDWIQLSQSSERTRPAVLLSMR